ncbi:four-carbon acid sugar kinase family protein [Siculibacillus lacustris]|uniref:Four-carbon acid sugar kinase family protein n=1 Tax=Siculibacillus lacustris TaxID=1549641 RepID=A0A4Q9VXQ6_9HYPH|nr:four-carbon acid sugar kinase family protein [Siculibacillus lacustris]TBW41160.1 four-carbon acid sugar kinase family protein [Siculibacillus lacustris]
MTAPWLIVADDLTGAADCGIAFAGAGIATVVVWDDASQGAVTVTSVDTRSRFLPAALAAARQVAATTARHTPGTRVYKKIDSTLRGQFAAELAAQRDLLAERTAGAAPMAIVAPAFPATGRTTEGGKVRVAGRPLEETPLWARDHTYADADLVAILAGVGIGAEALDLATIRGDRADLAATFAEARRRGVAALVCDAVTESDLAAIAAASLPLADSVMWVGTGGLAKHLAALIAPSAAAASALDVTAAGGPVLLVIGSVAEASRLQAAELVGSGAVEGFAVAAEDLFAGEGSAATAVLRATIAARLAAGRDVLVKLADDAAPDLARGTELADLFADWLGPVLPQAGALVMTGGDTACALLGRIGAAGIRLVAEVEPGVPIGRALGPLSLPVVSKAGAFGDAQTLARCLSHLKRDARSPAAADARS